MIQKQFTVKIPDELYVNNYSLSKVFQEEYMGEEIVKVEVLLDGSVMGIINNDTLLDTKSIVVELDCMQYPAIAYWLVSKKTEHFYLYDEEINHDGSVYTYPTNPRLQDYYDLYYLTGTSDETISEDTLRHGAWKFNLITKELETHGEILTKKNLEYVKNSLQNIELDEEYEPIYNKFIQDATAYLSIMEPLYPWKYVEITTPAMPKVPLKLIRLINEIKTTG